MPPHSLPLTLLGTGILWFGWFGFNAGSALGANGSPAQAFMNTHLAAAAAMLGWLHRRAAQGRQGDDARRRVGRGRRAGRHHAVRRLRGRASPASPSASLAGVVCFLAIQLKFRFGYDDSLDVVAVHLVGGIIGSLLLGLFADTQSTRLGADGLFFGGGSDLLIDQLVAVGATLVYSFVVSFVTREGGRRHHRAAGHARARRRRASTSASTQRRGYSFGELGSMGRIG